MLGFWSWNLEHVTVRVSKRMGWSASFAALVEREYRRFMALETLAPKTVLGMRGPVDEFWHEHILFTRDYAGFCDAAAGKFIHHEPAMANTVSDSGSYKLTLQLLDQHFGPVANDVWPAAGEASCGGDTNCAMCDKIDSEVSVH